MRELKIQKIEQFNLRMKEIETQNKTVKPQTLDFNVHFNVTKHIRVVPQFQEKEVDKYFFFFFFFFLLHFEKLQKKLNGQRIIGPYFNKVL